MDEPDYRRLAARYAALGHPTRLVLVAVLAGHPQSVTALAAGFDTSLQATSKHLQVLAKTGMVAGRRVGRERAYALDRDVATAMSGWLADLSPEA